MHGRPVRARLYARADDRTRKLVVGLNACACVCVSGLSKQRLAGNGKSQECVH